MSEPTKVEPKLPKSEQELADSFINWYKTGCEEQGFRLVISPVWVATNHGSFEMVLQESVGRLPRK